MTRDAHFRPTLEQVVRSLTACQLTLVSRHIGIPATGTIHDCTHFLMSTQELPWRIAEIELTG